MMNLMTGLLGLGEEPATTLSCRKIKHDIASDGADDGQGSGQRSFGRSFHRDEDQEGIHASGDRNADRVYK